MATDKGVWGLQQVRDKQLQDLWGYSAFGDAGSLFSMGYNNGGDLGHNNRTKYSSPTQIPGSWKGIGGVKSDGTMWSWGYNGIGALGLNDTIHRSSPTQVGSDTTWVESYGLVDNSDSEKEAFGIKTDGTLWAWGYNEFGQLGHNDKIQRSSPVQIPGTTWDIAGGGVYNGSATKTDGTLWVWGYGNYGMLGLATPAGDTGNTKYSSPVQITGTTWSRPLPMGTYAMGAMRTDGTIWVWGEGGGGILGQNSIGDENSPVQIPGAGINLRGSGSVTNIIKES